MIYTILFILTLLLSAFFSGTETAFVSANRLKLRLRQHTGTADSPLEVLASDERFLTSTLVGNNIMMVACSSLAVIVFSNFVSSAVLVFFTTAFLLLFGEIIPKSIATQIPNRLSSLSVRVLSFFAVLFFPIIWLTERLARQIIRLFGGAEERRFLFSKYELPALLREYTSFKSFDRSNLRLLYRSLKFLDKRLWDVMVPRTDIVGVEEGESKQNIISALQSSGFSRLPVFRESLDNITGFYYALDFLDRDRSLEDLKRPAHVFPESTKIMDTFRAMQNEKISIAVAVDEHGGTAGLVTIEDIVEVLVGAINDEYDKSRHVMQSVGREAVVVEGRSTIEELRERLGLPIPEGDYVTIAGLIQEHLGRMARSGDSIDFDEFKLKVLEATNTKINKVWLIKKPKKTINDILSKEEKES